MSDIKDIKPRVHITLSGELKEYYTKLADEMGVSINQCMVFALKFYKDAQDSKNILNNLPDVINQLQRLQQETIK